MRRVRSVMLLCAFLAVAGVALASEMQPYAFTSRPGDDIAIRSRGPVPYQCEDPWYWCGSCDFSAGGSSTDAWNADMEYDEIHNVMWTVEICGNYGLEAWDYDNPCQIYFDCDSVTGYCERGVAYDPTENRLYVSNWISGIVYKLDPEDDCAQLGYGDLNYLGYPYTQVSGLAYDENHDVIWVVTNSDPDWLFAIETFADGYYGNGTLASGFYAGPVDWGCYQGPYKGAGMDYDKDSNELYLVNQANQWDGTYTEIFDVGDGSAPIFIYGVRNVDNEGDFFGWGIGKKDGTYVYELWVTDINPSITPPCFIQCQGYP
jgi:hypothetical protein